jgi:ABC-2 type transport system permease protein
MTAHRHSNGTGSGSVLNRKTLRFSLGLTLILLAANLVAFNALVAGWTGLRLDFTEEGIYSITPATKRILSSLDEDVLLFGYFSQRTHPKLAPLVPQIEDLLEEYAALSRGRVKVEIADPGENELAEQEANDRFGVESTPFRLASKYETGIVNAYFAIVVQHADQYVRYGFDDLIEVERLPDGDVDVRLRNLEYDLTRAVKKVVYGFRSTAELFDRIDDPVRFTVIVTPDVLPEILSEVPEAIRAAAGELKEKGGEKFEFEEIDPTGDEALQQQLVTRYGAQPMRLGLFSDATFYLYGFLQVGDRMEQFNLVSEGITTAAIREAVETSLRRQTPGFLKTVGVVAPGMDLPPEVMAQLQMQGRFQQPPPEFQQVKQYLGVEYEVQDVELDAEDGVPTNVDVLLVLKPKDLSERAVYNLDQYLMRGGRVVLCAGGFEPQFGSTELQVMPVESGLDDWLAHYGISLGDQLVLDDRNQPLPIPEVRRTLLGNLRTWVLKPYPYLVEVREEGLVNRQITARLDAVGIYWGSPVLVNGDEIPEGLESTEILRSSARSWTSGNLAQVRFSDYTVPPAEQLASQPLAVAMSGRFPSYFAGRGAPGSEIASEPTAEEGEEEAEEEARAEVPLELSPETRLVVVGNAAFLSDFVASILAQASGGFFGQNLAFVQNLIDWTNLDNDLISIRARGGAARHLSRMERRTEVGIETVNYLLPMVALLLLGFYRLWQRRNTAPVVEVPGRRSPAPGVSEEG